MKLLSFLFLGLTSAGFTVPQPEGPYGVSLVDIQLNDTNRRDPYTGKPFRLLPVTIISPTGPSSACQSVVWPYMTNATAQYWEKTLEEEYGVPLNNIFSELKLSLCAPQKTESQYPLIFFSQGSGFPAEFYSILTTNLAAQGYVLVQVGIPGEIGFIQFPDGQIEYGNTSISNHSEALDVRAKDISFVLDYLSSDRKEFGCMSNINASSPSIFGHSFGGSTAMATIISDRRFVSGVNVDGAFWGQDLVDPIDRPFMILASTPNYTRSLSTVPNWAQTWPHLHGPKWLMSIKNTTHDSFVDISLIAEYFGLYKIPGVKDIFGEIEPKELLKIQVTLLSEMAKFSIGKVDGQNVTATAEAIEDVDVLNSTLAGSR